MVYFTQFPEFVLHIQNTERRISLEALFQFGPGPCSVALKLLKPLPYNGTGRW